MYISDRANALVYFVLTFLAPLAFLGVMQFFVRLRDFPFVMWALYAGILGLLPLLISINLYFRNRPAFGRNEDEVRRNIRRWYRDAKKWMDEHPEHVEMKDL